MRCPKCGYVSFDYLPRCKKCSVDLTEVRQALNLPDFKPEVPFLLGGVVGDIEGSEREELSLTQETELELASLDSSEPSGLEETIDIEAGLTGGEPESEISPHASLEGPGTKELLEETEVGEIDLEELDISEAAGAAEKESREVSLEDLAAKGEETGEAGAGEAEGMMGLEIETDLEETAEEPGGPGLASPPEGKEAPPKPEPEAETAGASDESALELDLSEEDLSSLAKELEEQLESEAGEEKKPRAAGSGEELEEVILELEKEDES